MTACSLISRTQSHESMSVCYHILGMMTPTAFSWRSSEQGETGSKIGHVCLPDYGLRPQETCVWTGLLDSAQKEAVVVKYDATYFALDCNW